VQAVLPYWAIYRQLGYIWVSFATQIVPSLHKLFLRYILLSLHFGRYWHFDMILSKLYCLWQNRINNLSNFCIRVSNFCLKFSHRCAMKST
jgi:hypothetical protein